MTKDQNKSTNRVIDKATISQQFDDELNIPMVLRFIIEDPDENTKLNFKDPNELM